MGISRRAWNIYGYVTHRALPPHQPGLREAWAGVSRQKKEALELASRSGLNVIEIFEDNDISASRYSRRTRPEFERMMERAGRGDFDTLLAWDLDRLIRSLSTVSGSSP